MESSRQVESKHLESEASKLQQNWHTNKIFVWTEIEKLTKMLQQKTE